MTLQEWNDLSDTQRLNHCYIVETALPASEARLRQAEELLRKCDFQGSYQTSIEIMEFLAASEPRQGET